MASIFLDEGCVAMSSSPQRFDPQNLTADQTVNRSQIIYEPAFKITKELQFGDRRFLLRQPVEVLVRHEDGLWIHESPDLSIRSYAEGRQESLRSFCEDFATLWDNFAQEADHRLTEDARALKNNLLSTVESVA